MPKDETASGIVMCNCCGTEEIAEAESEEARVAAEPRLKVRQTNRR
jgi:hypothetical protein